MSHCCLLLGLRLCLSFHVQSSGKIFTNLWVLEKRQTWRQDSRCPKIHTVFPPCNFITLLLSGPTLAKKTAGIFNNICFVSAKVAYAHNKNINITEGLIMKNKLTPLQSQPCFSEANPFSDFSWEFSLYLIYRFSKFILSKYYQSTLCYERWGSTQTL